MKKENLKQWAAVANLPKIKIDLNTNPSNFIGANLPVEQISSRQAKEFCARLSRHSERSKIYRLPSEVEWEYACRAGTTTPFHFGDTLTDKLANYKGDSTYANSPKGKYRRQTTHINLFPPNAFSLHDMHGNVWEWCEDSWYKSKSFYKVLRGGSWFDKPQDCRSAYRFSCNSKFKLNTIGFRVVCN